VLEEPPPPGRHGRGHAGRPFVTPATVYIRAPVRADRHVDWTGFLAGAWLVSR
jgi:hypothetical protein